MTSSATPFPPNGYYIYAFCKAAGLDTKAKIETKAPALATILRRLRFHFPQL